MATIRLLGTEGCHLCEQAKALLLAALKDRHPPMEVEFIDIIDEPLLYERFSTQIPVLEVTDFNPPLRWPFDIGEIKEYLKLEPLFGRST